MYAVTLNRKPFILTPEPPSFEHLWPRTSARAKTQNPETSNGDVSIVVTVIIGKGR